MFLIAMQNQLGIDAASSHYTQAASSGRNTVESPIDPIGGDSIRRDLESLRRGRGGMELDIEEDEREITRGAGDELVLDSGEVENLEEEGGIYL